MYDISYKRPTNKYYLSLENNTDHFISTLHESACESQSPRAREVGGVGAVIVVIVILLRRYCQRGGSGGVQCNRAARCRREGRLKYRITFPEILSSNFKCARDYACLWQLSLQFWRTGCTLPGMAPKRWKHRPYNLCAILLKLS